MTLKRENGVFRSHAAAVVRDFDPPQPDAKGDGRRTLARFSGTRAREYLQAHGAKVAKLLSDIGLGEEAEVKKQLAEFADVLELIDSADLTARADETTLRVALRVTLAKPLKQ